MAEISHTHHQSHPASVHPLPPQLQHSNGDRIHPLITFSSASPLSAIVVGGSIAGLCCAHALLRNGWEVVVLEKARSIKPLGAGLALEATTFSAFQRWGLSDSLLKLSLSLQSEEVRAVDRPNLTSKTLIRDPTYDHRSAHWSDLHRILYDSLPTGIVRNAHEVVSFQQSEDGERVKVQVKIIETSTEVEFEGNLYVAADGSMSQTRKHFVPHEERRYCGYCAWRGVIDSSNEDYFEVLDALRKCYPELGQCLYFDLAERTHIGMYQLSGDRVNWLWYVNQPEPPLRGNSVTLAKLDDSVISRMKRAAGEVWVPEQAAMIRATPSPFLNAIFDREPLKQIVWGRVVLVGEAAHPTTPHSARSTNMSIEDAAVMDICLGKWGKEVGKALEEYQTARLPSTTRQVLFSRYLGRLKQGFTTDPPGSYPWLEADEEQSQVLLQANWRDPTFII